LGNRRILDSGEGPAQENRFRVFECSTPTWVQQKPLAQGRGRRHKYGLYSPAVKNVSPATSKGYHSRKLANQVVAIKVGAAVHEYAILGIKLPDREASPVIVNKDVPR
jgi:hypothetical protein